MIEYKEYVVKLEFSPTVLSRGVISLAIKPEVSQLDYANSVSIGGTTIPGLTKRDLETSVELRDGQSFALPGLLQENNSPDISQIPWLAPLPLPASPFNTQ